MKYGVADATAYQGDHIMRCEDMWCITVSTTPIVRQYKRVLCMPLLGTYAGGLLSVVFLTVPKKAGHQ